jgi:hypothetical protein
MKPPIAILNDLIDIGKLFWVFLIALAFNIVMFIYTFIVFVYSVLLFMSDYIYTAATRKDAVSDRASVGVGKGCDNVLNPIPGAGVAPDSRGLS